MTVIKTLWKNKRHFKLQIFGMTVLLVVLIFSINLISIKVKYDDGVNEYLSSTVQYTNTFKMSLSGADGTIDNIFIDSSRKRCFILATVTNTSSLAMDANKYQVFVTNTTAEGVVDKAPREKLNAEFYIYGTSGRIGLYLTSDIPFENKMKKITLRSYKQYAQDTRPYFQTIASDAQYDQCHFFFNPGGSDSITMPFLETHIDGNDFILSEMYRQITTKSAYEAVCNKISTCQNDMIALYGQMAEYRERLTNTYKLAIPENPSWIKGDKFEDVIVSDEAGNVISSYRKFVPNEIFAGGVDFEWQKGNVDDGYYHLVENKGDLSLRDYLINLSSQEGSVNLRIFEDWYYEDGTEVIFNEQYITNFEIEMRNTIEAYKDLFKQYYNLKKAYLTDYLPELLELEFDSTTMGQSYTVNRDPEMLVVY